METLPDRKRINADLIAAYDRMAHLREKDRVESWKLKERRDFVAELIREGKTRLLEVGAGTGVDGLFFRENGIEVTCLDLSPEMVELCRRKGLEAEVGDFFAPGFGAGSFDALHALNALVHVGRAEWPGVVETLADLLRPGGLLYLGQYGGSGFEGILEKDNYRPKRFFFFPEEKELRDLLGARFDVEAWRTIPLEGRDYVFYGVRARKRAVEGAGGGTGE